MMVDLTEEEMQIIVRLRAKEAAAREKQEFLLRTAETAALFFRYLDRAGMEPSFSEFVNSFGYQGGDAGLVYEFVLCMRKALWK